jgi:hypothetical protein
MSDTEHGVIPDKVIRSFDLDLSDVPTAGETRYFSIKGDSGAQFRLEIKMKMLITMTSATILFHRR